MCGEQFLSDSVHDYAGSLPVFVASAPGERGEVTVDMSCGAVAPAELGASPGRSGTSGRAFLQAQVRALAAKGAWPFCHRGHPSPRRPVRPALIVPLVHSCVLTSPVAPVCLSELVVGKGQASIVQDERFLSGALMWDHPWQLS